MTGNASKRNIAEIDVSRCVALRRNPQFVSPHQMEALKASIQRDGFLAPVLLRPMGDDYEVVSGNHRVMAARELGMLTVPALIVDLDDKQTARIAVNLNTVHGDPTAELLAPFLAELDDETLQTVHLDDDMLKQIMDFDDDLKARLDALAVPAGWDNPSPQNSAPNCHCRCGHFHVAKKKTDPDE